MKNKIQIIESEKLKIKNKNSNNVIKLKESVNTLELIDSENRALKDEINKLDT